MTGFAGLHDQVGNLIVLPELAALFVRQRPGAVSSISNRKIKL
jgi:hypothetical protein